LPFKDPLAYLIIISLQNLMLSQKKAKPPFQGDSAVFQSPSHYYPLKLMTLKVYEKINSKL